MSQQVLQDFLLRGGAVGVLIDVFPLLLELGDACFDVGRESFEGRFGAISYTISQTKVVQRGGTAVQRVTMYRNFS